MYVPVYPPTHTDVVSSGDTFEKRGELLIVQTPVNSDVYCDIITQFILLIEVQ